jgi:hypothetical protein
MGEAKRRRDAKQSIINDTIPDDIKRDIAKVVRSIQWDAVGLVGGMCFFNMLTGYSTLCALNVDVTPAVGGMIFRAGPDQYRDVVAWCGAGNLASRTPTGGVLAHYYLTGGNDIVDFSVGDWKTDSVNLPDACFGKTVDLGPVRWGVELPDYFWGNRSSFERDTDAKTPAIGRAWYGGCTGEFRRSIDLGAMIKDTFATYEDTIISKVKFGLKWYGLAERLREAGRSQ